MPGKDGKNWSFRPLASACGVVRPGGKQFWDFIGFSSRTLERAAHHNITAQPANDHARRTALEGTEADCHERLSLTASAANVHHQEAESWPRATLSRQREYRSFEQEAFGSESRCARLWETHFSAGCCTLVPQPPYEPEPVGLCVQATLQAFPHLI
jgi:hypothetical protein